MIQMTFGHRVIQSKLLRGNVRTVDFLSEKASTAIATSNAGGHARSSELTMISRCREPVTPFASARTVKTAWNKADLMFLMDALQRGIAEADVARFLGRSADEVRDRAKALKRRPDTAHATQRSP